MKAIQWERAKGELRAMVALQGIPSTNPACLSDEIENWKVFHEKVEAFIKEMEDEALV